MRAEPIIERWRGIGLILAVFAVALRLALPAGFMPSAIPGAGLVICDGVSADPHGAPDPQPGHDPKPCMFAAVAAAPAPDEVGLRVPALLSQDAPAPDPLPDLVPGRGLAAPPPPATGPPLQTA